MFAEDVFEKAQAAYFAHILLIDSDELEPLTDYSGYFAARGFNVVWYKNDLSFRIKYYDSILMDGNMWAVIAPKNVYIPYDVQKRFHTFEVKLSTLYSRLNSSMLREQIKDYDLLSEAYKHCFDDLSGFEETKRFIDEKVFGRKNVSEYLSIQTGILKKAVEKARNYKDWYRISDMKSKIDVNAVSQDIDIDTSFVNEPFKQFIISHYGQLSSVLDRESPVLVSKVMEFMHERSDKFAIVVMDGMSQFDWHVMEDNFTGIKYQKTDVFAMIPTTTSISRQCLLSNKYPIQLINPWAQSQEKKEFTDCASRMGFLPHQIGYERGYDAEFGALVMCAAVIVNNVDDMVHGQQQGRIGMYNDISVLGKQKKLCSLTRRLLKQGFDVYISADHGNTVCTGSGKLIGTGVDVETKSRRMLVLKDFADKQGMMQKYDLIEYPGYYLNKDYDYLICQSGHSFDAKGSEVMSHGGITLDEVVVPFITVKAVENNG